MKKEIIRIVSLFILVIAVRAIAMDVHISDKPGKMTAPIPILCQAAFGSFCGGGLAALTCALYCSITNTPLALPILLRPAGMGSLIGGVGGFLKGSIERLYYNTQQSYINTIKTGSNNSIIVPHDEQPKSTQTKKHWPQSIQEVKYRQANLKEKQFWLENRS